jgi:hypothetical protein
VFLENSKAGESVKRVIEGVELTNVKYTHSRNTRRNPFDIDLGIKNERQVCKIGTVCVEGVVCGGERVNGGEEGEEIWSMDFIYIYKIAP